MTAKTIKILGIIILSTTLTYFGYVKITNFFKVDSCLDSGGRWNYEKHECELGDNQLRFDTIVLADPKYASGHEYGTHKKIQPKVFHFDNYTFVTGFPNDSGIASLGLYYMNKEILYETSPDGFYDTIMTANLNNDSIPDFLVSYAYEDGAELYGLISTSKLKFVQKKLIDEWHETYCAVGLDTLRYVLPLQIRDINNDGKDEIISNFICINNKTFAISCTDTVFADKIK